MTGDKIAVIDLGSNTFHLLICVINEDGSWTDIYKEREYVKLASGGIQVIDQSSEKRAIDAMTRFAQLIKLHEVKRTKAIGTAALREAANGMELAEKLFHITGIKVEIIDGKEEARYILLGIQSALPPLKEYGLIMDIGGGSVEFILYKGDEVAFTGSFNIGVAVLYKTFHHSDPISGEEIDKVEAFLGQTLKPLVDYLENINTYYLVGASGSFEVLYDVLQTRESSTHWAELDLKGIEDYMDGVIGATHSERKLMPEIPVERLDYIVVAYLLIRYVIKTIPSDKLYYCDYALKEGVIAELIRYDF